MRKSDQWVKRLVRVILLTVGLVILIILLLNVDGWGTFAWSWAAPFLVQTVIALILFGILLAVLRTASRTLFRFALSRRVLPGFFLITAVLALPFLTIVFRRPVDIYDAIQTILLIVAFNFLTEPFKHFLRRFEPKGIAEPILPHGQRPFLRPTTSPQRSTLHSDEELYRNLLRKVMGDRETAERLIEFERGRARSTGEGELSRDELLRRAIERLELDNS